MQNHLPLQPCSLQWPLIGNWLITKLGPCWAWCMWPTSRNKSYDMSGVLQTLLCVAGLTPRISWPRFCRVFARLDPELSTLISVYTMAVSHDGDCLRNHEFHISGFEWKSWMNCHEFDPELHVYVVPFLLFIYYKAIQSCSLYLML